MWPKKGCVEKVERRKRNAKIRKMWWPYIYVSAFRQVECTVSHNTTNSVLIVLVSEFSDSSEANPNSGRSRPRRPRTAMVTIPDENPSYTMPFWRLSFVDSLFFFIISWQLTPPRGGCEARKWSKNNSEQMNDSIVHFQPILLSTFRPTKIP
jgi:hypothetical protein